MQISVINVDVNSEGLNFWVSWTYYDLHEKTLSLILFNSKGDHYSKLSVLGCKYLFYPEKPLKRKVIRGSILCGQVLAAPVVGTVALVAGAGAIVIGCIALPAYGSYKLINFIQVISKLFFFLKI